MKDYPGLSKWVLNIITGILARGQQRDLTIDCDDRSNVRFADVRAAGFGDGRWGRKPRNAKGIETEKGEEMDFLLGPVGGPSPV